MQPPQCLLQLPRCSVSRRRQLRPRLRVTAARLRLRCDVEGEAQVRLPQPEKHGHRCVRQLRVAAPQVGANGLRERLPHVLRHHWAVGPHQHSQQLVKVHVVEGGGVQGKPLPRGSLGDAVARPPPQGVDNTNKCAHGRLPLRPAGATRRDALKCECEGGLFSHQLPQQPHTTRLRVIGGRHGGHRRRRGENRNRRHEHLVQHGAELLLALKGKGAMQWEGA
ncbi:uncharacterized protein Tco025E_00125 [Trypanosoma conorhini]|uniref:Uncharacterized protein n=1 Tax=Trypanosoma conorhini TaxID=83891 RepID=A0A3R7Q098_9TRYP|nr:uncharacterized protein Tco025E_00125 [Trypanosoma conorhini]RNF27741.1 hypothetical protein Tco025E_00125 [Trypanosoma conorhini]